MAASFKTHLSLALAGLVKKERIKRASRTFFEAKRRIMACWLARSCHRPKSCGFAVLKCVFPPLRRHAEGEKPVSLWPSREAVSKTCCNLKTRQGGSSERGRVSEHLEECPCRLARPLPPKSWDVSRREGVSSRRGNRGRRRTFPNGAEILKSSAVCLPVPNPFQPVSGARERFSLPRPLVQPV